MAKLGSLELCGLYDAEIQYNHTEYLQFETTSSLENLERTPPLIRTTYVFLKTLKSSREAKLYYTNAFKLIAFVLSKDSIASLVPIGVDSCSNCNNSEQVWLIHY